MIDTPHPRTTPDVNQTSSDFDRVYKIARQALRHQRDFAVEFRILRPDGTVKYLEATGHPLFSTRGELFEVLATQVEVADRRYAQEHARLRELESALAHMNRLSIMGELAASLAHEILHPIATARNNARAGMRFLEMSPPNLGKSGKRSAVWSGMPIAPGISLVGCVITSRKLLREGDLLTSMRRSAR